MGRLTGPRGWQPGDSARLPGFVAGQPPGRGAGRCAGGARILGGDVARGGGRPPAHRLLAMPTPTDNPSPPSPWRRTPPGAGREYLSGPSSTAWRRAGGADEQGRLFFFNPMAEQPVGQGPTDTPVVRVVRALRTLPAGPGDALCGGPAHGPGVSAGRVGEPGGGYFFPVQPQQTHGARPLVSWAVPSETPRAP